MNSFNLFNLLHPVKKNSLRIPSLFLKRNYFSNTVLTFINSNNNNNITAIDVIDSLIHEKCEKYEKYEVCIVFISRNYLAQEIEMIPKYIYSKLQPNFLTGCVVDKIFDDKLNIGNGISLFLSGGNKKVGNYEKNNGIDGGGGKNYRIDGFNVNLEGPRKEFKTKSVGRWKDLNEIKNHNEISLNEWYDVTKFQSISRISSNVFIDLPEKLKDLKDKNISPELIFLISDSEPYQFLESLDYYFPQSKKMGIIGSSTPFITGRPYSLFNNDKVLSKGIIGIAFTSNETSESHKNFLSVDHLSMCSIGDPFRITSCQGNIILELEGLNPTKLLLQQHLKSGKKLSKDTEFYLGLYDPDETILNW
ncbi:8320_t:CDS:2 [Diversispora eburnea]|uniref:8320_t:CDS:1 n=1 Tax=Diversispora eburnea TaxID=1213867 RepID=A0A9N8YTQ4_9GLOM|nr:8320_t:CDS:2 [Diversispora eburnea]